MRGTLLRSFQILLFLLSVAPIGIVVALLAIIFVGIRSERPGIATTFIDSILLMIPVIISLTTYYLYVLFHDPTILDSKRILWTLLLLLWFPLAAPAFWYLFVWRRPSKQPVST